MTYCQVTADLNRYLAQEELDEAHTVAVASKLDTMMGEAIYVANALDDMMGSSDIGSDGYTMFAADLASVLMASDAAFEADAIRYFHKLRDRVRDELRDQAESLVKDDIEYQEWVAEEVAQDAREDARTNGR